MRSPYDPDLFAGTAEYYSRYRAPYAPEALEFVAQAFRLGSGVRVLDLGCGPGTLSIPLARRVGEVVAMDPDWGMLAEGRRLADAEGLTNIDWREGGSADLWPDLGMFRLVTMGQSFHWMDRDRVLAHLYDLVEDGGGIACIAPGERRPQEVWAETADAVTRAYLGEQPPHPQRNREPRHEPALERSDFEITAYREFGSVVERDVHSVIGLQYSTSGAARRLFGDRVDAYEADLTAALLELNPEGVFRSKVETGVLVAMKR